VSRLLPVFTSSLDYTQVRDFAYHPSESLHYGPTPADHVSEMNSPVSEGNSGYQNQDLSWEEIQSGWKADNGNKDQFQLEPINVGHGPPYSEDEDLQSPVVTKTRHRKAKNALRSSRPGIGQVLADAEASAESGRRSWSGGPRTKLGINDLGGMSFEQRHSIGRLDEGRQSAGGPGYDLARSKRSTDADSGDESEDDENFNDNDSQYSKEYQFTITSPDEEMHGKAVALFDFQSENENELSLTEGQIVWISYRQGEGWLVAEDPKTHESGLVPEEYVRLFRDIEGGWSSLNGDMSDGGPSPISPAREAMNLGISTYHDNDLNARRTTQSPLSTHQSSFVTSSKDVEPVPVHLLENRESQAPPVVPQHTPATSTATEQAKDTAALKDTKAPADKSQ
jgi:hypothetical protein